LREINIQRQPKSTFLDMCDNYFGKRVRGHRDCISTRVQIFWLCQKVISMNHHISKLLFCHVYMCRCMQHMVICVCHDALVAYLSSNMKRNFVELNVGKLTSLHFPCLKLHKLHASANSIKLTSLRNPLLICTLTLNVSNQ